MDLSFSADQVELQELARRILADGTAHEHVKAVLATDDAVDHELWRTMAEAGLVGISLPEAVGGGGLGFLETCIVLEEVGRAAAPVPALVVMGLGGDRARGTSAVSSTSTAWPTARASSPPRWSSRWATRSPPRPRPTATAGSRARRCACPRASTRRGSWSPPMPVSSSSIPRPTA